MTGATGSPIGSPLGCSLGSPLGVPHSEYVRRRQIVTFDGASMWGELTTLWTASGEFNCKTIFAATDDVILIGNALSADNELQVSADGATVTFTIAGGTQRVVTLDSAIDTTEVNTIELVRDNSDVCSLIVNGVTDSNTSTNAGDFEIDQIARISTSSYHEGQILDQYLTDIDTPANSLHYELSSGSTTTQPAKTGSNDLTLHNFSSADWGYYEYAFNDYGTMWLSDTLVNNGDFTGWSGGAPVGWTVASDDVNNYVEEASNGLRIVSDNTSGVHVVQPVTSIDEVILWTYKKSAHVAGSIRRRDPATGSFSNITGSDENGVFMELTVVGAGSAYPDIYRDNTGSTDYILTEVIAQRALIIA